MSGQKAGGITFDFESDSSKNFNLYSKPINIKNPTFDLEVNVIFPLEGDTACYPKNEFELKTISKNFSLIVSKDAKIVTLALKNTLYDTNKLVGERLYILDICPEGSYYSAGGNMSNAKFNFDINRKSFENLINDTTYGKFNNSYIQIKLDASKTPTEADYQELGKLLDGIEGLEF